MKRPTQIEQAALVAACSLCDVTKGFIKKNADTNEVKRDLNQKNEPADVTVDLHRP